MSIKGTSIVGLKVIATNTGKEIETVSDVIYDPAVNKVVAILIDPGGWFNDAKIILTQHISSIGPDAVIIPSDQVIQKASQVPQRVANIAKGSDFLTKTNVVTEGGVKLGSVTDIFFVLPSGQVEELEVSGGTIANIKSGKKTIKISDIVTVGEDAIIVRAYTEQKFEEQAQNHGVQGAVAGAMVAAGSIFDKAREKTVEMAHQAGGKLNEAVVQNPKIQQITEDFKSGKMEDGLRQNLENVKTSAVATFDKAKEATQSTATQVKDNAQGAVTQTQSSIQDKLRHDALGKYLTINLPLGQTIVPINAIITEPLLLEAEKYNMLDKVLDNNSATVK